LLAAVPRRPGAHHEHAQARNIQNTAQPNSLPRQQMSAMMAKATLITGNRCDAAVPAAQRLALAPGEPTICRQS
jgi:hypothetical protein